MADHRYTAALSMPEAAEGTHFGMVAFSVRGAGFVSVTQDDQVQLQVPDDVVEAALAAHPGAEPLVRMGKQIGLRVPLDAINGKDLNALVRAAWFNRAPKRLAAALADIDAGRVPANSDLPPAIGKPAIRALLGAGLTTLDQLAERSEAQLLALHGVGPKAVRILAAALAERGKSLA